MSNSFNSVLNSFLGENNWKAYCINLDIAKDRRDSFLQWSDLIGLTFDYWKATDKNTLTHDDYNKCDVIINNTIKSPGATACRLSHLRLFKHLLETYPSVNYFLVFEDDCGFKNSNTSLENKKEELFDFINAIKDGNFNWDSIVFGYHDTGAKQLLPLSDKLNFVLRSHLAHATIYKRSVLEEILFLCEQKETKNLPFDWITDILRNLKSITVGPKDSIIDQVDNFSYIMFNYGAENKKENIIEDLMRCCVQFPTNINDKIEFKLNPNTLYGDVLFLPHSSLKSFALNSKHLKNPVVVVSYDEKSFITQDVLSLLENQEKILAIYTNCPAYTSDKIIDINLKDNNNIVYWKKLFDSHKTK